MEDYQNVSFDNMDPEDTHLALSELDYDIDHLTRQLEKTSFHSEEYRKLRNRRSKLAKLRGEIRKKLTDYKHNRGKFNL
jgi:hypothetical protein